MDTPLVNGIDCPYESANIFSTVFLSWPWSLVRQGNREEINHNAMYTTLSYETTNKLWGKLNREWTKELKKKEHGGSPSFRKALARAYGLYYVLTGIIVFLEDCCRLLSPVLLQWLLEYFEPHSQTSRQQAYLYAMGIALSALFQSILSPNIVFYLSRAGVQWQAGTCAMIYRKALKLSNGASSVTSTGHIVDLMASDAEKLCWNVWFLHFWRGFFQSIFALTYTYYQIGPSVFTAIGFVVVMIMFQFTLAKIIAYYREKTYKVMDKRVDIVGEIIGGMRVIKMYCWEKPFGDIVAAIRQKEVNFLWSTYKVMAVLSELFSFNQRCLTAIIVIVYVYLNGTLSAAKVFPMFSFFGILSYSTLDLWPWGIKTWLETSVSAKRIENFLLLEERQDATHTDKYIHKKEGTAAILSTNVHASWSLDSPRPTLRDVSFSVNKGELLTVVGEVGAGKSSILMAICGELPVSYGSIFCGGKIAYCAQQPWIFSSSIRQNILFGMEYQYEKYQRVIEVCSLEKDLALFPSGDQTLVGDKGVTLSGGQKARVSLARAVYADADVYLLDDPLSAVDTHVGRELFANCIKSALCDKATVLVTHQLQYLSESDKIIVLHQGEAQAYGTYDELMQSGIDFAKLLPKADDDEDKDRSKSPIEVNNETETKDKKIVQKEREDREEEDRAVGNVTWSIYWQYFNAGSNICILMLLIVMNTITQILYNGGDWWLSVWSDTDQKYSNSTHFANGSYPCNKTMPWDCLTTNMSVYVYAGFLGTMFLCGLSRALLLYSIGVRSSNALHRKLYTSVVRAPIRFHDTNPKGRIVNRFSSDVYALDNNIPDVMQDFLVTAFTVGGSIALMSVMNPVIALPILPILGILVFLRKQYLGIQRQLQRLFSAAHSPVLTHLNATLDGMHTIRAFDNQRRLVEDSDGHYDALTGTWFTSICVFSWFFCGVSIVCGIFNVLATFACLVVVDLHLFELEPGDVGLILSYVTSLMYLTQHAIRLSSDLEIQMVRAERVIRYSLLSPEADLENEENKPAASWPDEGKIVFDHVSFGYSPDTPLVLKNIFCEINPQEKVGIVGRTGAGKSSFIQCLFRMAEPIGQIRIDNLPINEMGLYDVRSKLAIIPQDPTLFSGTVRYNLDPFEECSDESIWNALEQVQLKETISSYPESLHYNVTEGGSNFSVGQKQLFCLARAILKNTKILILDEATANIDKSTDNMIQSTIRDKFHDCTVLTVAHRLHTVMDSDRIFVFDNGSIIECDTPFALLQNPEGHLYQMTMQTGQSEYHRLYQIAEEAYVKSRSLTDT